MKYVRMYYVERLKLIIGNNSVDWMPKSCSKH